MADMKKGLTFDDVILVPKYSEILPGNVDLNTRLTAKIKLNIIKSQTITITTRLL